MQTEPGLVKKDIFTGVEPFGKGFESLVYVGRITSQIVKIPNTEEKFNDHIKSPAVIAWLSSPEHGKKLEEDYKKAKKIFGDDIVTSYFFSLKHPLTGTDSFAQVQRNYTLQGYTEWSKLSAKDQLEIRTDPEARANTLDFFWKVKEYCVEFSMPFDLIAYGNNIAYNKELKKFIIVEAGFPTELLEIVSNSEYKPGTLTPAERLISINHLLDVDGTFPFLRRLENSLKVTPQEAKSLNLKHFENEDFDFNLYLDNLEKKYQGYKENLIAQSKVA